MKGGRWSAVLTLAMLSACSVAPPYVRPPAPVPSSWPVGDAYLRQSEAALPSVSYTQVFTDLRLQQVIGRALANNRDLRVAVANIAAARARYRVQRSDRFPSVDAGADYRLSRQGGSASSGGGAGSSYSVDAGVTAFEIDLFGRVRSLTGAALDRYLATEAAARATRLTLVGDIADAWLQLAADRSLLLLATQTVAIAEKSVGLTRARLRGGVAPRTDLAQAEQILATAQANVAEQTTAVAQDLNALELLVGAPVEPALLPAGIDQAAPAIVALSAGVDSAVLLRRPDVVQAEYELRAANGDIGAARAALFPRVSLTGVLGLASTALTSLFTGSAFNFSAGPSVSYNIFSAGAGRANVALSEAQREATLAQYERTIQVAFRETADALARQGTIDAQIAANRRFAAAAADSFRLTDARYRGGIDTFLASLDAQRSLYTAQQQVVRTTLVAANNRVALYRALGGDSTLDVTSPRP